MAIKSVLYRAEVLASANSVEEDLQDRLWTESGCDADLFELKLHAYRAQALIDRLPEDHSSRSDVILDLKHTNGLIDDYADPVNFVEEKRYLPADMPGLIPIIQTQASKVPKG